MLRRDIIVIGASMGGLEAFKTVLSGLPRDLEAAVCLVWHISPNYPSYLPQILERVCDLPVTHAQDGELLRRGHVYVASPDHHLVLENVEDDRGREGGEPREGSENWGRVRVTHGPKENLSRPSIDVLFRSAARAYGSRVIGVLLTGLLDDGVAGLHAIKERGGQVVIQDPLDAEYPNLPINAMKVVALDYSVPVARLSELLIRLVREPLMSRDDPRVSPQMDAEVRIALEDNSLERGTLAFGEPTLYTCPECHGALLRIKEGDILRFRCHTGHAFSFEALMAGVSRSVEDSLWSALRVMQEQELLLDQLERHLRATEQTAAAEQTAQKRRDLRQRLQAIREVVLNTQTFDRETLSVPPSYEADTGRETKGDSPAANGLS